MRIGWRLRVLLELLRAFVPMLLIERSLRSRTLPQTCRRLSIVYDTEIDAPPDVGPLMLPRQERAAVRAALLLVSRWPGGDTCLRQCLLIGYRLRAHAPVLRIGVRRDERGVFQAHSWLEFAGRALDSQALGYSALGPAPASTR